MSDAQARYHSTAERLEPGLRTFSEATALTSIAVSLKRIADLLEGGSFLGALFNTLDDASHNHAQRMKS